MKTVLMLATTAAMIEQFNKDNILILEEMGYEVHVAGNFQVGNPISEKRLEAFKEWIVEHHGKWFHIPATRKPTDMKHNVDAYIKVIHLIQEYHYEFIHCHTPIGSVIGRLAAHKTHTKIIYTAHGFHFFKGAPLINWILYYPVERFLSRWTDMLILINKEDFNRAKKSFHAKRTEYIPGVGVDTEKYRQNTLNSETRRMKREELGVNEDEVLILSVGELIKRKNHMVAIEAISKHHSRKIKYAICGKGILEEVYRSRIKEMGLENKVLLLGFREDICELCNAADIYLFPSKQEGLSLALMEAMAAGLPIVASNIRGNADLIDKEGGYLVKCDDVNQYVNAIEKIAENPGKQVSMGTHNLESVEKYNIKLIREIMKKRYLDVLTD